VIVIVEKIQQFLTDTIQKYDFQGVVVGISGGIDSALVAGLCTRALGNEKVFGLLMPERDSATDTLEDSILVCRHFQIPYRVKKISPILRKMGVYRLQPPAQLFPRRIQEAYVRNKWESVGTEDTYLANLRGQGSKEFMRGVAYSRAKHRTRMCCLYLEAEQKGYAVVGTTNRTEMLTGLYVKWGDDSVDIEPLLHLYKRQVFQLAKDIGVPDRIIQKPPTPDLVPGITDEFAFRMTYEELDRILEKITEGGDLNSEDPAKVGRVQTIMEYASKFKMRNVRMPIDQEERG